MNPSRKQFFRRIILFSIVLFAIGYLVKAFIPQSFWTPAFPFLVAFFMLSDVVMYNILERAMEKKFSSFVNYFLLGTFIKLLLYIAVLVAYVYTNKGDALPFAISFFILYLLFTFFEVVAILSLSKNRDPNRPSV